MVEPASDSLASQEILKTREGVEFRRARGAARLTTDGSHWMVDVQVGAEQSRETADKLRRLAEGIKAIEYLEYDDTVMGPLRLYFSSAMPAKDIHRALNSFRGAVYELIADDTRRLFEAMQSIRREKNPDTPPLSGEDYDYEFKSFLSRRVSFNRNVLDNVYLHEAMQNNDSMEGASDADKLQDRHARLETQRSELLSGALGSVATNSELLAEARVALDESVRTARAVGATWAQIGEAAGMSAQSANQRWRKLEKSERRDDAGETESA